MPNKTPLTNTAVLRAQLVALEFMYRTERRCANARRILNLIHVKRDELSAVEMIKAAA